MVSHESANREVEKTKHCELSYSTCGHGVKKRKVALTRLPYNALQGSNKSHSEVITLPSHASFGSEQPDFVFCRCHLDVSP